MLRLEHVGDNDKPQPVTLYHLHEDVSEQFYRAALHHGLVAELVGKAEGFLAALQREQRPLGGL